MLDNYSACFTTQRSIQVHLTMKNRENIVNPNIAVSHSNSCGRISIISNDLLVFQIFSLLSCEIADKAHFFSPLWVNSYLGQRRGDVILTISNEVIELFWWKNHIKHKLLFKAAVFFMSQNMS